MRNVLLVASIAMSLLFVVSGSGCGDDSPPLATDKKAAMPAAGNANRPAPVPAPTAVRRAPGAARRDIVNTAKKKYSQFDEEIIIRDFFQDRRGGFFLDVGCAFPDHNSTTLYLDHQLGWNGIAVDAVHEYAKRWAEKRPDTLFLNYLISDHSDTEDIFYKAKWPEVSSAKLEMVEKYEFEERTVRTITLDKLLEDNGVDKIDFMSMDIEGFQMTALAAFDIQKYQPELVGIEAYRPDRPKINAWFEERGYKRIDRYLKHDFINWYYTPAGNPALSIVVEGDGEKKK